MAITKYDLNRFKRTYPLIRLKPIYQKFMPEEESVGIDVETAIISFVDEHQKVYSLQKFYTEIPVIALTPENENVNIFVTSLTTNSMTIESSAPFTGKVHIQVFKAV